MTTPPETSQLQTLAQHHPLIIEGMGDYDPREPAPVAANIVAQLHSRWSDRPPTKPVLLVTQGDPLAQRGISAITRLVADALNVPRALVYLDAHIADYHAPNADRYQVILEVPYSHLVDYLRSEVPGTLNDLEAAVRAELEAKNARRAAQDKPPLKDYFEPFALLQEVTKVACQCHCGEITVAHTSAEMADASVSSFYQIGLALGLLDRANLVAYSG